ncbi:MAG: Type 1 glutamine amidotransferase-like domain-containing protein [Clostridia bacterium]|nr:Type 1 glutamine amidotransferase-like domain-containing protein [Clostridia bacterium]
MGKLVLGSGGIFFENESDPIIDHVISLIGDKPKNSFVYLPTGGHDTTEDEEIVRDYCTRHGFKNVRSLYLSDESLTDDDIRDTILGADVIYAGGGNLMFLLDTWRKTKADVYLRQAFENGTVIAGQSSGAMCWCRTGYDNCGPDGSFIFLPALDFIPYVLCPHFEDWPEFLTDVKKQPLDALGVDNDIVISIVDGDYTIVDSGRNPAHTAYFMPAENDWKPVDIMREHVKLHDLP